MLPTTISEITRDRCVAEGWDVAQVEHLARFYCDTYRRRGHVGLMCREMLEQPDYLWRRFITELDDRTFTGGCALSPIADRTDSKWMREYDYCFINARATSLDPSKTGTFLQAAKLLPVLRSKGIHLAPFFDCNDGFLYSIDSLRVVNPLILDQTLLAEGASPDDHQRFFIDMAHLCGIVVGFDIEPHVGQFSRIVLENPDKFRWLRINKQRSAMLPASMEAMLKAPVQKAIVDEMRSVVENTLQVAGLASVEPGDADPADVRRAHMGAVTKLANRGFWTLHSHNWDGVGLPNFKVYNEQKPERMFEYRNVTGNCSEPEFAGLTPFRFYDDLPVNDVPTPTSPPKINPDAVEFFAEIFPELLNRYGFDFIRWDYVDHEFDSVMKEEPSLPIADRGSPSVLKKVIARARRSKPYIGAMAERLGTDVREYGSIGFDLLLGADILRPIDAEALTQVLSFSRTITNTTSVENRHASVLWVVDTRDSGHPLFWARPIAEVVGSQGMLLRQFVARFATPGPDIRPKYECVGNQDMSTGHHKAINSEVSLEWVGDRRHCRLYHALRHNP